MSSEQIGTKYFRQKKLQPLAANAIGVIYFVRSPGSTYIHCNTRHHSDTTGANKGS